MMSSPISHGTQSCKDQIVDRRSGKRGILSTKTPRAQDKTPWLSYYKPVDNTDQDNSDDGNTQPSQPDEDTEIAQVDRLFSLISEVAKKADRRCEVASYNWYKHRKDNADDSKSTRSSSSSRQAFKAATCCGNHVILTPVLSHKIKAEELCPLKTKYCHLCLEDFASRKKLHKHLRLGYETATRQTDKMSICKGRKSLYPQYSSRCLR
ncbi:hypothetical protein FPOAC2_12900 [Fusarium poae]